MQRRKRARVKVKGVVQGVGFRPFVYRLAKDNDLKGYVRNTTNGVDIEIEGTKENIVDFIRKLRLQKPRASQIDGIAITYLKPKSYKYFTIKKSRAGKGFTQISPDIATCIYCLKEFYESKDRRYKFPFINCTNCGPRYSIIYKTPYDRKFTSMKSFSMCQDCKNEFYDVMDRRFHAQPDCCAECGPRLALFTRSRKRLRCKEPIKKAAELLRQGKIIAIKGLGGFHIACDATNKSSVERLRRLKHRLTKPFALMVKSGDLKKIIEISEHEKQIINSPIAPILLARKKGNIICDAVAPKNPYLGVMVPYTPMHYLLLDHIKYLVMTSANIQDEPIIAHENEIVAKLGHIISHYLTHDRTILNRCDDSVGFYLPKRGFSIMRRSRGYAPSHIDLPCTVSPSLAVGPYLKNTFTLADKKEAYVSPHIGDLDNRETLMFFQEMIRKYKDWFRIEPTLIIHDQHPDYLSTKIAQMMEGKKMSIQHHKAHIVSCLGEHGVTEKAIGIAFDGTGYGTDGKIWGSEFFIGDLTEQKRVAHLEYLPLPGGETSIRKPYRIALAYVETLIGKKASKSIKNMFHKISMNEYKVISKMLDQERNVVYTSSMGRLFDSVAALLGLIHEITYEAEGAINLEYAARSGIRSCYPYILETSEPIVIKLEPLFRDLIRDIKKGIDREVIAAKFHNTIAAFTLDVTKKLSKIHKVNNVCLSGGVFQNRYLLNLMIAKLERSGYNVFFHKKLPTNDGCISYGQIILGNAKYKKKR